MSCQLACMKTVSPLPAATRNSAIDTTRRIPNRSISAAAKGAVSPNNSRFADTAKEMVPRLQPNSSSSGLISTPGVARKPAAPMIATKATPATSQARWIFADLLVGVGMRPGTVVVTTTMVRHPTGFGEWPGRHYVKESGHGASGSGTGPQRSGRVRPRYSRTDPRRRAVGRGERLYEVRTCTADGGPVRSSGGFRVLPDHGPEILDDAQTVIIPGVHGDLMSGDPSLTEAEYAALQRIPRSARLVSICTGAFALALAGKLDGRPATTHWAYADRFRTMFPLVRLNPDVLFVDDGDVLTSAGVGAGVDLCLHLVRRDFGSEVANGSARRSVLPPWRDGGQAQFIVRTLPSPSQSSTAPRESGRRRGFPTHPISRRWPARHR
jgi:putative intracellular protease/amidase